jgi:hypothetical protein
MLELAHGSTDWFAPRLLGIAPDIDALLPYWLGAWVLHITPDWIAPDFAVRLPFMAMLAITLVAVWQGVYALARSPLAQPVAFAFGGEAPESDYARALADGGLLAFTACLGLAQLSHETTPALAQLCFTTLSFFGLAALPYHRIAAGLSVGLGLLGLTLSGAPSMAVILGTGGLLVLVLERDFATSAQPAQRWWDISLLLGLTVLSALLATQLGLWRWRIGLPQTWSSWQGLFSLLLWFTWPAWPLVLWTLWRWRRHLFRTQLRRHLAIPLWFTLITVGATLITPAGDRALLLALPALAALAAFALPTLSRNLSALIDWFTLLFFTSCCLIIWVVWIAMQTGFPPQPAANVARLAPGFEHKFVILPFIFALLGTLAWGWLVKWRVGRHRSALWKCLVLPAGGAALCWLLLTTLWMPLLDHARSYAPLIRKIEVTVAPQRCIEIFGLPVGLMAGFKFHSDLRLEPTTDKAPCDWLVVNREMVTQIPEIINPVYWSQHSTLGHPREGEEDLVIYRRVARPKPR